MAPISQREAHRLRRRVEALEEELRSQRNSFTLEWPSSVCIRRIDVSPEEMAAIKTARLLEHAVVAVPQSGVEVALFANKLRKRE